MGVHPFGSMCPVFMGPAWTVVPVGCSVLLVVNSSRWVQTRWDTTLPILGLKQQPPINVWAPSPLGLGAGHLCHIVI